MQIFGKPTQQKQKVTTGRFELEQNGQVAYLEYVFDGNTLQLIHTQVPEGLRGMGIASSLAQSALEWAREHKVKVDVICPSVGKYIADHPEYSDLVLK